jgi:hypothetical protein
MTVIGRIVASIVVITVAAPAVLVRAADVELAPTVHHPMSRYVDAKYRFSFWHPSALRITVAAANDDARFPGGVTVETVQVGSPGGIALYVVNSPQSTITDEPNGHAAPIPQTRYFYDASPQRWMVAYPEGTDGGGGGSGAPADVSKTTIGSLPMLPGGARFDTTIIPLATTQFVVVQDGGGSEFTNQLARTIAAAGARVEAAALSAALRAEALGYEGQLQITISPATLCLLQSSSPCKK